MRPGDVVEAQHLANTHGAGESTGRKRREKGEGRKEGSGGRSEGQKSHGFRALPRKEGVQ